MKRLKAALSAYKALALCAAVLMMISLTFVSISIAKSGTKEGAVVKQKNDCFWYHRRVYYSDATYTTSVSTKVWFCDGLVGTGGPPTAYYIDQYCDCIEEGE